MPLKDNKIQVEIDYIDIDFEFVKNLNNSYYIFPRKRVYRISTIHWFFVVFSFK